MVSDGLLDKLAHKWLVLIGIPKKEMNGIPNIGNEVSMQCSYSAFLRWLKILHPRKNES